MFYTFSGLFLAVKQSSNILALHWYLMKYYLIQELKTQDKLEHLVKTLTHQMQQQNLRFHFLSSSHYKLV